MSTTSTKSHSNEFLQARYDFAAWYESKPEEVQFLIDEIADKTSFIIDENAYDEFINVLSDYDIVTPEEFADKFQSEYEGVGESNLAMFAKDMCDYIDMTTVPSFIQSAIDWENVYYTSIEPDFHEFTCGGNTYFFRR
jgi:hypothetical protein